MNFTEEKGHSNQYYADPDQNRPAVKELYLMKDTTGAGLAFGSFAGASLKNSSTLDPIVPR
jgi:hypothetical protein